MSKALNELIDEILSSEEVIRFKKLESIILKNEDGRKIVANYGMDPKLGKYHRTYCEVCDKNIKGIAPVIKCDTCDSKNITMGVFDRIELIKDKKEMGKYL